MKPRWKIPSLDWIIGMGACVVAASPTFMIIVIATDVMRGVPLVNIVAGLWTIPVSDLMWGYAMIMLLALPSVVAIEIAAYVLTWTKHDAFAISTACGAVIGYVVLSITLIAAASDTRYFGWVDPFKIGNAAISRSLFFNNEWPLLVYHGAP